MNIQGVTRFVPTTGALALVGMIAFAALPKETKLIKINTKRIPQDLKQMRLCRSSDDISPHGDNELDLFVNDIAIDYRKKNPKGNDYPPGSAFVKVKYIPGKKLPYSRTIMVRKKNETGKEKIKPSITDWEFTSESLPDGKEQKLSKTTKQYCMSCHDNFHDTGFISKRSEHLLQKLLKRDLKNDQDDGVK